MIYEDPRPESSDDPSEHMLCTYQCRQMVKSEFFDTLSSVEKQALDYKSKFEALTEKFQKAEAERQKFKDQFFQAEQELAAAKGREQGLQEQLLKEVNDSQDRLKKQIQAHSDLEIKLRKEVNLRQISESSATSAEEKARMLEIKLSDISKSIEKEKKHTSDEVEHMQRESKLSLSRIRADLERMECRSKHAEKESELLRQQLEEFKNRLNESLLQKGELEKKLTSSSSLQVSSVDNSVLVKHLQEELRKHESEVQEAKKLKCSHENIELLEEKLLEEKCRRERLEQELVKLSNIQLNMKKLEDELSSWKILMKEFPGVSCAEEVLFKFAPLQREVIESMGKVSEATARVKQLEAALDAAELGKQRAEAEASSAREAAEASKLEIKRLESVLSSVSEERERLKNLVNGLKKQKNVEAEGDLVNQTLFKELESSLSKKEYRIKDLESSLNEQKDINSRQHREIQLLNERLSDEARRMKHLEREGDRLHSQISLLESKLGHGDFSSASTKVLRMVNTLGVDDEAKQTIEALKNELQKTKEKLQAVEELKGQSADAGLVDSFISGKIAQYKEQIAKLEKREERYKTVFADRISVFRRACCELFGYKIVMDDHQRSDGIPVTRFILQSIYAQSDDEKLEFEYESGNTSIIANSYTSQPEISNQVVIFVRKMNSIPAFTANLTMESFNKRTLS